MKKILYPLLAASLLLWACEPKVEPLSFAAPVVEFPLDKETISVSVGEPQTFSANIVAGEGLTVGWYVDGVLESSNHELTYTWKTPGTYSVRFGASNGAGKVEKNYSVEVTDVLEIFLSSESDYKIEDEIECLEDSRLRVYAVVAKGSNVKHQWTLDGELQTCTEAYFDTYQIPRGTGTHEVSYKGTNAVGTYEKDFTVNVLERPLTIEFSETASTIVTLTGEIAIEADVRYGVSGVTHSWYVDDVLQSQEASFEYRFANAGNYVIRYYAKNSKNEEVERIWNVVRSAREEVLLEDYENGVNKVFIQQNGGKLSVVDNPYPDDVNNSGKVLQVTGGGSGYFGFVYSELKNLGVNWAEYDGIKVDMYITEDKFYPVMDFSGMGKVKANADTPYKYNQWVSLDYDLNFVADEKQLQPRPFCNASGGGNGNNSTVYYDNVYLYKKQQ